MKRQANFNNNPQTFFQNLNSHDRTNGPDVKMAKRDSCEYELPLSLEEVYRGCVKRIRVTMPPAFSKILEIDVKRGWKSGTKIKYACQLPGADPNPLPCDVHVVIKDKPHETYERLGSDLVYNVDVPLREILCGRGKFEVPKFPDGDKIKVDLNEHSDLSKSNFTLRYSGAGLPYPKNPLQRGDLIVKVNPVFPDSLKDPVKAQLLKLLPEL